MALPAFYGFGVETFVTDRSELLVSVVESEELLLPVACSLPPVTVAVLVTEPGADWLTVTVTVTAG